jgi:hypothetical protein
MGFTGQGWNGSGRAGDYTRKLRWLKNVTPTSTTTGDRTPATYTAAGYLWCNVVEETGQHDTEHGAVEAGAAGTIRVRNYPALSALDLLKDEQRNIVWHIDSIHRGDDEIILDAYRLDDMIDYTIV